MKKFLEIGKVVNTHGLKGELRVVPWCDIPELILDRKTFYLDPNGETHVSVKYCKQHKGFVIVKLDGVDSVEDAERFRGVLLHIDRASANLPPDVHFIVDIIGLAVYDADTQYKYGKVTDVLQTGANDVYEIETANGKKLYAPVIDDVVKEISAEDGYIKIKPLEGLFDD